MKRIFLILQKKICKINFNGPKIYKNGRTKNETNSSEDFYFCIITISNILFLLNFSKLNSNHMRSLALLVVFLFLFSGCGKKDDKTTSTDTKSKTTETKKDDKKKKDFKKSSEPKKDIKTPVEPTWTKLTSSDGKMIFSLPSDWTITENTDTRLGTMSPDSTMGSTAVVFGNDKISADDLLGMALADFDFNPEGEAHFVEIGDIEAYYVGAVGKINGVEMSMLIMSAIDASSHGNYVVYAYTPTANYAKNQKTMEDILFSVDFK